jgi:hypothetical protein
MVLLNTYVPVLRTYRAVRCEPHPQVVHPIPRGNGSPFMRKHTLYPAHFNAKLVNELHDPPHLAYWQHPLCVVKERK